MRAVKGVVYGKGINDSGRSVTRKLEDGSKWICPNYEMWKGMLRRCLDEKFKEKHIRYLDCRVSESWLNFSKFDSWVGDQDLKKMDLDKDLLVYGNKLYSPETCVIVPERINRLMGSVPKVRGEFPVGVNIKSGKYHSQISDRFNNKQRSLGYFETPELAHSAWQKAKANHIRETIKWWRYGEYSKSYNLLCGESLLSIADKIDMEQKLGLETILI